MMKPLWSVLIALAALMTLVACGGTPTLVGNWRADDGTGTKVIMSDGSCPGMYYDITGTEINYGGSITCSMSDSKDSRGWYTLIVRQIMLDQQTLYVEFEGNNTAKVYDRAGNLLFTMKRQ